MGATKYENVSSLTKLFDETLDLLREDRELPRKKKTGPCLKYRNNPVGYRVHSQVIKSLSRALLVKGNENPAFALNSVGGLIPITIAAYASVSRHTD